MQFLVILKMVLALGAAAGLFVGLKRYFTPAQRAQRALLLAQLAKDAVALIVHQRGMTANAQEIFNEAVQEVLKVLLNEGVGQASASVIAPRLVAGAISSLGVRGLAGPVAQGVVK